ncbi:KOW motif-containing protein [Thermodesulfovibrio hydrogeniphilus]
MAYIIYAQHTKYIKILRSILSKAGFLILDTEFPECIIVIRNPSEHIPADIKKHIQIEETKDYKQMLKGFDSLTPLIKPSKNFKEGDPVKIVKGTYEGFSGVIKKINEKNLEVEISVRGKLVKDVFEFDEVEKIISIF